MALGKGRGKLVLGLSSDAVPPEGRQENGNEGLLHDRCDG